MDEALPCADVSFFDLTERLIRDPAQRRPLLQICLMMRKSGATWILEEKQVHKRRYFRRKYVSVLAELRDLRRYFESCELGVTQISFCESAHLPARRMSRSALQKLLRKSRLLATCIIVHVSGMPKLPSRSAKKISEIVSDYVFEAVITQPSHLDQKNKTRHPLLNHHLHVYDRAIVIVLGIERRLSASYFCQQNLITTSCSHTAIKMAHWHLQNSEYQLPTAAINDIVARNLRRLFAPGDGLSWSDFQKLAEKFDMNLLDTDFEHGQYSHTSSYELAYLFVESGFPTLIFFRTEDHDASAEYHVVPVLGHTVNSDEWLPTALRTYPKVPVSGLTAPKDRFLSSVEWIPQLIIHDDLLGPYMKIGPNSLSRPALPNDPFHGRACRVAAVVEKHFGTDWSPLLAQQYGTALFRDYYSTLDQANARPTNAWMRRLHERWSTPLIASRDIIARTQLLRNPLDYSRHLAHEKDFFGNTAKVPSALKSELKKHTAVWLTEISISDLYCTNRSKLGEVVLPFNAAALKTLNECQANEAPAPIAIRLMGNLRVFQSLGNILDYQIGFDSHIQVLRSRARSSEY